MKIDLRNIEINKKYIDEVDVDFSSHTFSNEYRIRRITSCHVRYELISYDYLVNLTLYISGTVVGACSYTNEDVELKYKAKENMTFATSNDVGADYVVEDDLIDLDPYLLAFIDAAVPYNIIKPGATRPNNGDSYVVMSEEEYYKSKKKQVDPRWSKLDEIDFD